MKKILFILSTVFMIIYLLWLFPAFCYSNKYFINKYSANAREQLIITDVYGKLSTTNKISMWGLIANYVLFAGAVFYSRKKPSAETS